MSIFGGSTWPITVIVRDARPAAEHDAVTRAGPGCTCFGTVHVQVAVPPAAVTVFRPFCLARDLYRTDSEQRAPAGETMTLKVAGLPCTTRSGPAMNVTPCARPLAAPAKTATPTTVARARGSRRFVALAVMSSGGVPRRHFLFRPVPWPPLPLGRGIRPPEGGLRGVVAAHAVDAGARRCRGRAEIEPGEGRGAGQRAGEARKRGCAGGDVAADKVRVAPLHPCRVVGGGGEDPLAEAGREAFDLVFDVLADVDGRAVGDVAVRPRRVLADGRARVVEETLLREQDKWLVGVPSLPARALGLDDLCRRAAEVDGGRACSVGRAPRDRAVERVVDFE